jgi:hypothetical protein
LTYFLFDKSFRNDILDSVFTARLVELLKCSSPSLQEKAASVMEFVALADPTLTPIISVDIENGLNSAFQQNLLKISGKRLFLVVILYRYLYGTNLRLLP